MQLAVCEGAPMGTGIVGFPMPIAPLWSPSRGAWVA